MKKELIIGAVVAVIVAFFAFYLGYDEGAAEKQPGNLRFIYAMNDLKREPKVLAVLYEKEVASYVEAAFKEQAASPTHYLSVCRLISDEGSDESRPQTWSLIGPGEDNLGQCTVYQ